MGTANRSGRCSTNDHNARNVLESWSSLYIAIHWWDHDNDRQFAHTSRLHAFVTFLSTLASVNGGILFQFQAGDFT